jgi:hypothetical protein
LDPGAYIREAVRFRDGVNTRPPPVREPIAVEEVENAIVRFAKSTVELIFAACTKTVPLELTYVPALMPV